MTKPTNHDDAKARFIKAVQTCRRKVAGLEADEDWRAFLERATGKTSLRAMSGPQLGRVLDALHAAGAPKKAQASRFAATSQMRMIRGLWIELADLGQVQDRSESALSAFVTRQTGQDLGRLNAQASARVIEALKSWRGRAQAAGARPHG
jgi:phage gp16-like protein